MPRCLTLVPLVARYPRRRSLSYTLSSPLTLPTASLPCATTLASTLTRTIHSGAAGNPPR
jgi:hypothetical protein